MTRTFNAVFEDGVLRPLESLDGLPEHVRVKVTVEHIETAVVGMKECIGIMPDDDAAELRSIIEAEFEQVNPSEW